MSTPHPTLLINPAGQCVTESAPSFRHAVAGCAEGATPSSNHGVISPGALQVSRGEKSGCFDYLTVTVSETALRLKDDDSRVALRSDVSTRGCGLPSDVLDWLFPIHSLKPDAFEPKGWQGYKYRANIFAPGLVSPVGLIARGGNRDTVCVSISGAGMPYVNVAVAKAAFEAYGVSITRLDAAFDDLDGTLADIQQLKYDAQCGMFDSRGRPPFRSFVDDLGSGAGCSLYVGRKGAKQLNIYEKGKQQGDAFSPWIRYEARLWANNRVLPLSMLDCPRAVLVGAYPYLSTILPNVAPSRAVTSRHKVEANTNALLKWLETSAGRSLHLLKEASDVAGLDPMQVLETVMRQGLPKRFAGTPDVVAIQQTANVLEAMQ